jgi:hypothetical protein
MQIDNNVLFCQIKFKNQNFYKEDEKWKLSCVLVSRLQGLLPV